MDVVFLEKEYFALSETRSFIYSPLSHLLDIFGFLLKWSWSDESKKEDWKFDASFFDLLNRQRRVNFCDVNVLKDC